MQITPSAKSAAVAGFFLALIGWATLFEIDPMAKLCRVNRWVKKDPIVNWIEDNKKTSFLITEFINFGVHGITGSTAVTFALGSTVFNALAIFLFLPFRRMFKRRTAEAMMLNGGVVKRRYVPGGVLNSVRSRA